MTRPEWHNLMLFSLIEACCLNSSADLLCSVLSVQETVLLQYLCFNRPSLLLGKNVKRSFFLSFFFAVKVQLSCDPEEHKWRWEKNKQKTKSSCTVPPGMDSRSADIASSTLLYSTAWTFFKHLWKKKKKKSPTTDFKAFNGHFHKLPETQDSF